MGGFYNLGIRTLADTWLRFYQPGFPCFLRLEAVDPSSEEYAQLGFVPSVTGFQSGVVDVLIQPPADVRDLSLLDIGMNSARLQFGAKEFLISHTFVLNRMQDTGFTDMWQVWRDPSVVGLYFGGRLFAIESVTPDEYIGSQPILWRLLANSIETPGSPGP